MDKGQVVSMCQKVISEVIIKLDKKEVLVQNVEFLTYGLRLASWNLTRPSPNASYNLVKIG